MGQWNKEEFIKICLERLEAVSPSLPRLKELIDELWPTRTFFDNTHLLHIVRSNFVLIVFRGERGKKQDRKAYLRNYHREWQQSEEGKSKSRFYAAKNYRKQQLKRGEITQQDYDKKIAQLKLKYRIS